jgi:hypothetical protein
LSVNFASTKASANPTALHTKTTKKTMPNHFLTDTNPFTLVYSAMKLVS